MNPPPPPERFGVPVHTELEVAEFPMGDNFTWIKHTSTVFVDVGLPLFEENRYTAWFFRDDAGDEFGPVRGFDVPFDLVGDWDPTVVPPIDGELISTEVSLAQSGMHLAPAAQGSSEAEHEPEPEVSQAEAEPMDIDLEPIPEEEPEEAEPEVEPGDVPEESEEPVGDPEYILPYEEYMDPNFVPEFNFFDFLAEENQNGVPAELGDINHPIEIEAGSSSSEEQTDQESSGSEDEESASEWTPSKGA